MDKFKTMQNLLTQIGLTILLIIGLTTSLCAQYTLTDDDVVVEEGVIRSCSYGFTVKDIIIPGTLDGQTVTGIGDWVFQRKGLTSVSLPANLENIGSNAFNDNDLTEILLPATIKSIESYAFYRNNIAALDLSICTSLLLIEGYAFRFNSLSSILLPEVTYNETVYTLWKDSEGNNYIAGVDEETNW